MRIILLFSAILVGTHAQETTTTPATTTTVPVTTTTPATTTTAATTTASVTTTTVKLPPPHPFNCNYANNSLGDCSCNGQLFIQHMCHSGFFCLAGGDDPLIETASGKFEGCELECGEGETLVVNPTNGGSWDCVRTNDNSAGLMCPGAFNTECGCLPEETPDEPDACKFHECECPTQVWVAHDCHEARICGGTADAMTTTDVSCKENTTHPFVNVNLLSHDWFCGSQSNCLGSFHVGCQEDTYDPTTEAPGGGAATLAATLALAMAAMVHTLL